MGSPHAYPERSLGQHVWLWEEVPERPHRVTRVFTAAEKLVQAVVYELSEEGTRGILYSMTHARVLRANII